MNYFCNRIHFLRKAYMIIQTQDMEMRHTYKECGLVYEPQYKDFADYVEQHKQKELEMWRMAKELHEMVKEEQPVWYLVSIRPDSKKIDDIHRFVKDVEYYVEELPWIECMYAFEQKGETLEDAGKGFHVHILFSTKKVNYYASHILRDIKRKKYSFINYTAANCIQIDKVNCKERAVQYISGDKKEEGKSKACKIDILWREQVGLKPLVTRCRSSPDDSL